VDKELMRVVLFVLVCRLVALPLLAEVTIYPAPAGETLSGEYQVWADGKKVDV